MATEFARGGTADALGIDVGGTGIKGGLVDVREGRVLGERIYLDTPTPSTPEAVAGTISRMVRDLSWEGPVGVALPSVIHEGVARSAANVDPGWVGCDVGELFERYLPEHLVTVLNDADGAGVTEAVYGAARDTPGLVLLLTLGTGIGSALLVDGRLVPNSELGHLIVRGVDGVAFDETERFAAGSVRFSRGWSFEEWTPHLSNVLRALEDLLWPSLIVLGGGVSEAADEWFPLLDNRTPVVAATRLNDAGLIGAAAVAVREDGAIDLADVLPGVIGGAATNRRY